MGGVAVDAAGLHGFVSCPYGVMSLWDAAVFTGFWLSLLGSGCSYGVPAVPMEYWLSLWGAGCLYGVLDIPMGCWLSLWSADCPYGVLAVSMGCYP